MAQAKNAATGAAVAEEQNSAMKVEITKRQHVQEELTARTASAAKACLSPGVQ